MQRDPLSTTLYAIADPTRRAVLAMLMEGDRCIKDLAQPLEMSLPAVTKHIKVLEEAGLVQKTVQAQWRTCHLNAQRLQEVESWLNPYRRLWERRLNALEDIIEEIKASDNGT